MSNIGKAILAVVITVLVAIPVAVKGLQARGVISAAPVVSGDEASAHKASGPWARPFVDDPEVLGKWESVDFVGAIDDFTPGEQAWTDDLFLKGLNFMAEGRTSGPWKWTKGYLYHPGDQAEGKYEIKTIAGTKYLFMEWISGDVTIRGEKPWFYVMKPKAE